ncbi:MAG: PDZ domain-containing protein [Calditrichaeota bacterium]|nr:MAG: PDZ domain-containing protein [Calditrichota bacterium]
MLNTKFSFVICLFLGMHVPAFSQSILSNLDAEINEIVEQIKPSVVTVSALIPRVNNKEEKSLFSFFGDSESNTADTLHAPITNIGTGIVLHEQGYVVTKSSVVAGADFIYVQFDKDTIYLADFLGFDRKKSIALLRIDAPGLIPLKIGDPDLLRAGSWTVLVGNSLGIASSVSLGNVNLVHPDGLLQIAVNTSPGNNGSPVMNSRGQVIGMVSGRLTLATGKKTGGASGTECALVTPIDQILDACTRIGDEYHRNHGWIGITVKPYEDKYPKVVTVYDGSPADKSGLKKGDVLMQVDTTAMQNFFDLRKIMQNAKPGKDLTLHIKRNGEPLVLNLTTSQMPVVPDFSDLKPEIASEPDAFMQNNRVKPRQFEQRMLMMERQIQSLKNQLNKLK